MKRKRHNANVNCNTDIINPKKKVIINATNEISKIMKERTGYEERVQSQVALHDDTTGLCVTTSFYVTKDKKIKYCFKTVYSWVWLLCHPEEGHPDYKISKTQWNKIPMVANKALFKRDRVKQRIKLEEILKDLIKGDDCKDKHLRALLDKYGDNPEFKLPNKDEIRIFSVDFINVNASKGDLIFYKSFHANASQSLPSFVQHIDYLPHSLVSENCRELLSQRYKEFKRCSQTLGAGSGRQPKIEEEYYEKKYPLKYPRLPNDSYTNASLGKITFDSIPRRDVYEKDIISENDKTMLEQKGYLVIKMEKVLDTKEYKQWMNLVDNAITSISDFFNYAILERNGITNKRFNFSNRYDKVWDALTGENECAKIFGEQFKKILYISKKSKDGKGRTFCGTAQGGNGMVTKSFGMGHATNLYRNPKVLKLTCSKFVVRCFQILYGQTEVHNCTDRFRVKCGTGNPLDDKKPRTNIMPIHEDRLAPKCLL